MNLSIFISLFILIHFNFQTTTSEFRNIKGIVTDSKKLPFAGASIQEYDNLANLVLTNVEGEFEIKIPNKENVLLKITYGCSSFYAVLHEVKVEDNYVRIELYSKKTDRKTKKIIRKLNRKKKIESKSHNHF